MSAEAEAGRGEENMDKACCASCGIAAVDEIKLKDCSACKLVKYCGVKCQREHWQQHKKECKKRVAELRDEIMFKQPESSNLGDCPICLLPLPIDRKLSSLIVCCCKIICNGCAHANQKREAREALTNKCPFCRHPLPNSKSKQEVFDKYLIKRADANDPAALYHLGMRRLREEDSAAAFECHSKAASLGNAAAHYELSTMYHYGEGVERDEKKMIYHWEQAAIGGHPVARHNLGSSEYHHNGDVERAIKHWIIAANLGYVDSLKNLKLAYQDGFVSKDVLAAVLRAHQATIDDMKSPQRDEAESYSYYQQKQKQKAKASL